jgi:glycerol uptake facilitator-like aquaporin
MTGSLAALARQCAAEIVGTFALVFIGPGACIAHHRNPDVTHVGVALAFGGVVACAVFAFARISGAHINPAVTLALAATGKFPLRRAAPYVLAQCAGALAASADAAGRRRRIPSLR